MLNGKRMVAWGSALIGGGLIVAGICWKALAAGTPPILPTDLVELRDRHQRTLAAINVNDGIDQPEAGHIANIYSWEYLSGCGGALDPELAGGIWTSKHITGVAGKPSGEIVEVDARTGAVWSKSGPVFASFEAFRRDVLDGFTGRRE